jgi:hypothetical protein
MLSTGLWGAEGAELAIRMPRDPIGPGFFSDLRPTKSSWCDACMGSLDLATNPEAISSLLPPTCRRMAKPSRSSDWSSFAAAQGARTLMATLHGWLDVFVIFPGNSVA